jgi:hypothetical protein
MESLKRRRAGMLLTARLPSSPACCARAPEVPLPDAGDTERVSPALSAPHEPRALDTAIDLHAAVDCHTFAQMTMVNARCHAVELASAGRIGEPPDGRGRATRAPEQLRPARADRRPLGVGQSRQVSASSPSAGPPGSRL